jgi:autotransporter translocation and assembly factor TamB
MTLSGPAASASTSTSVTGGDRIAINVTWKIIANSPQGEMPLTAVLRNEGGQISGTVESQLGQTPIVSGRVIGNEVSFKVKIDAQGNQLEINFSGTISGETMKGQVSSAAFPNIEFTGKKEK